MTAALRIVVPQRSRPGAYASPCGGTATRRHARGHTKRAPTANRAPSRRATRSHAHVGPIGQVARGPDHGDHPRPHLLLAGCRTDQLQHRLPGCVRKPSEQLPVVQEARPQHLRYHEHPLRVHHLLEDLLRVSKREIRPESRHPRSSPGAVPVVGRSRLLRSHCRRKPGLVHAVVVADLLGPPNPPAANGAPHY